MWLLKNRLGAWLSLVERLNGVQEAASSILVAPIKNEDAVKDHSGFSQRFLCNRMPSGFARMAFVLL